jgi:hypothetical protein
MQCVDVTFVSTISQPPASTNATKNLRYFIEITPPADLDINAMVRKC